MEKKERGRKVKQVEEDHWGQRLASVLKEKNLSNRATAKLIGVSPSLVDSWVRTGASPADLKVIKILSDKLDCDFCWLLTGERSKETTVRVSDLFKEVPYFDGLARIRIDRLIPNGSKDSDED